MRERCVFTVSAPVKSSAAFGLPSRERSATRRSVGVREAHPMMGRPRSPRPARPMPARPPARASILRRRPRRTGRRRVSCVRRRGRSHAAFGTARSSRGGGALRLLLGRAEDAGGVELCALRGVDAGQHLQRTDELAYEEVLRCDAQSRHGPVPPLQQGHRRSGPATPLFVSEDLPVVAEY